MVLAVCLGLLAGLCACIPLVLGIRVVRTMDASSSAAGYLTPVLLALGGSVVVLAFATMVVMLVAEALAMVFVLAEAGALIVGALAFGFWKALHP